MRYGSGQTKSADGRTDGRTEWTDGRTDDAKTISLRLRRGITSVGLLTFISMINTTSERFKARNFFICQYFSVLAVKISYTVELSM